MFYKYMFENIVVNKNLYLQIMLFFLIVIVFVFIHYHSKILRIDFNIKIYVAWMKKYLISTSSRKFILIFTTDVSLIEYSKDYIEYITVMTQKKNKKK